jgi:protein TonB
MKNIVLVLISLLSFSAFSQIQGEDEVYLSGDKIEPKFEGGGLENFYKFINKEFDFSKVTKVGKMITAFTIDDKGEVKNIKVVQFVDVESATEIIRVLKKCPKWEPATKGGKPYSVEIKFPLEFKSKDNALVKKKEQIIDEDNTIYNATGIEVKPEFPGGIKEFYNFIAKNFRAPDVTGLKGKVILAFVVDKDGSLTDIKVLRDVGFGSGAEAIRVLGLSPKWIPAEQNGQHVRCSYLLPINIETSK